MYHLCSSRNIWALGWKSTLFLNNRLADTPLASKTWTLLAQCNTIVAILVIPSVLANCKRMLEGYSFESWVRLGDVNYRGIVHDRKSYHILINTVNGVPGQELISFNLIIDLSKIKLSIHTKSDNCGVRYTPSLHAQKSRCNGNNHLQIAW